MSAPKIIEELVDRFNRNIESYKSGKYNETQVRNEFINPFFEALGWDVINKAGYAEAYKDVIHEYSLKTKDVAKAPDYLFRIGSTKKFFVEAKKPSVNLKDDISPAFQLRRYAWTAKLPLSILTDFEELAIYDCRIQPKKNDKSSTARIMYLTYKEYIDKWDELVKIFSKDAVLKGSFDKFAETSKGKRGTTEVDDAFLKEIENWRELLARNIALRNPNLTNRQLNYSVQKIIDRIIFLRISEDRGIEDYGQLYNLLNGINIYKRLKQIFKRADEKYNSGLFHFDEEKNRTDPPDEITPALAIDDKVLKDILKNLYYPDCPYEFSVLGTDILGHVYEQFLGKVIRLTAGHRAVVEEKPEVKKAGGVYYTPTYIVDYIVKNTVGKKLEEIENQYNVILSEVETEKELPNQNGTNNSIITQTQIKKVVKEASKLKILDPACGSGSFLLGAYQYLLDWHLKIYTSNVEQISNLFTQKAPPIYRTKNNEYRLTTNEKKRILLNNIYGVDIDNQAVEVTKLSLLLKVLEGETDETLNTQISMFKERALPDLSNNIKCGNSLIGPDFYDQMEMNFLDEEEKLRINVFDWETEFKEIMSSGGFDCVIGNPPYLNLTKNSFPKEQFDYLQNKFTTLSGGSSKNLFQAFIEKIVNLKPKRFSFIVPEALSITESNGLLRKRMIENYDLSSIVIFDHFVFRNANIGTMIFVLKKKKKILLNRNTSLIKLNKNGDSLSTTILKYTLTTNVWEIKSSHDYKNIIEKIKDGSVKLGELAVMSKGMVVKDRKDHLRKIPRINDYPFLLGRSMNRYEINVSEYTNYDELEIIGGTRDIKKYYKVPKLLIRRTGNYLCVAYEEAVSLIESTIYFLFSDSLELKYLLGLLNSKLLTFYLREKLVTNPQGYPQILMWQLKELPIKKSDNEKIISKIITLASNISRDIKNRDNAKTPQEKTALQRQIDATDKQIDKLVYELYGLTEEEIKIVEESF